MSKERLWSVDDFYYLLTFRDLRIVADSIGSISSYVLFLRSPLFILSQFRTIVVSDF